MTKPDKLQIDKNELLKMKYLLVVCVFAITCMNYARCEMSEAQMQSAVKLMRKVCQPKTKVTIDQIEGLHRGEFPDVPEIKCYAECVLKTAQILKDGKLNLESLRTQMSNLPKKYSEPGLVTIEKCKDSIKGADKCSAAYSFYKCYYDDNPEGFFLP